MATTIHFQVINHLNGGTPFMACSNQPYYDFIPSEQESASVYTDKVTCLACKAQQEFSDEVEDAQWRDSRYG